MSNDKEELLLAYEKSIELSRKMGVAIDRLPLEEAYVRVKRLVVEKKYNHIIDDLNCILSDFTQAEQKEISKVIEILKIKEDYR